MTQSSVLDLWGGRLIGKPEIEPRRGLQPLTAASRVVDGILAAIEGEEWKIGDRLPPERHLMHRFGVGRPAIREAIASLATRGVLLTRPGCRPIIQARGHDTAILALGSFVSHMLEKEEGIANLFNLRVFVEAALVRIAAKEASAQNVEQLRQALENNRKAIGDPEQFYRTDVAFHAVFYRIPSNPLLPLIHKAYVEWLSSHWLRMPRSTEINRMNYAAHEGIFQAILRRDADEAERLLLSHLATAWQFVRVTFLNTGGSNVEAGPEFEQKHSRV